MDVFWCLPFTLLLLHQASKCKMLVFPWWWKGRSPQRAQGVFQDSWESGHRVGMCGTSSAAPREWSLSQGCWANQGERCLAHPGVGLSRSCGPPLLMSECIRSQLSPSLHPAAARCAQATEFAILLCVQGLFLRVFSLSFLCSCGVFWWVI